MKAKLKIYIACGSGIATSTVVQEKVKEILKRSGIQASITKGNIAQIPSMDGTVDLILVTSRYTKQLKTELLPVFGLISGINEEQIEKQIVAKCKKLSMEES